MSLDDLIFYYQKYGIPFTAKIVDSWELGIDYQIIGNGLEEDGEPIVVIA